MIYNINFPHFNQAHSQVFITLFRNVSNAAEIKGRIVAASIAEGESGERQRETVNFAFLDARLVSKANVTLS
jgi:EKC/KEOPS complex subunit CGI121/TPRKB